MFFYKAPGKPGAFFILTHVRWVTSKDFDLVFIVESIAIILNVNIGLTNPVMIITKFVSCRLCVDYFKDESKGFFGCFCSSSFKFCIGLCSDCSERKSGKI